MLCLWPLKNNAAARVCNSNTTCLFRQQSRLTALLAQRMSCCCVDQNNFASRSCVTACDPGTELCCSPGHLAKLGWTQRSCKQLAASQRAIYCQGKAQQLPRSQNIMCAPRMAQADESTEQSSKVRFGKKEKKARRVKPVLELVSADGDSKFARALGSTDYQTREKGLQALTLWMSARADITEAEMLKILEGAVLLLLAL